MLRAALLLVVCAHVCAAMHNSIERNDMEMNTILSTQTTMLSKRNFHRHEDPLAPELADRTSLLFRSLDQDRDRLISAADVRSSVPRLHTHMPGVSADEFVAFIEVADTDGDHKLSRDELFQAIADGLKEADTVPAELVKNPSAAPNFIELVTQLSKDAKGLVQGAATKVANKALDWASSKLASSAITQRVTGAIDISQDSCVMCQYIVERCEVNLKQSGVVGAMGVAPVAAFSSYLEQRSQVDGAPVEPNLIETESENKQIFPQSAAGIIGTARQATRVQRQLERQKFNEIYRVVDISLDDVCEQGMPNSFYGYCKQVYKVQTDVVDGMRYQYRPADICFRIGMCGKNSYITKGIHTRYK